MSYYYLLVCAWEDQRENQYIYAIKYQVYCMENTVQWSANTVQLF